MKDGKLSWTFFPMKEKRETEKNMEVMWSALRKHPDGIGFLELVMNMQSFAQLCENCFTLSFLVSYRTSDVYPDPIHSGISTVSQ